MTSTILLAVHDSPAAFAAARHALALAARLGAEVRGVGVLPGPAPDGQTEDGMIDAGDAVASLEAALRHVAALAAETGVPFAARVVHGPIARSILEEAAAVGADYIAMAAVDRPARAIAHLGSHTLRVLEFSEVPVLVVPATPG